MFHLYWSSKIPPFCIPMYFVYTCFVSFWLFYFLFSNSKKKVPVNWHDVPVPRGTFVSSLSIARCVPHKHGRQMSSSELARVTRAYRHDRASCATTKKKTTHPAIWHGVTVPHGTTVPTASGFSAPISFFLFLIFLLLPHLFSLYDGKTLTSPPCYPPSPLKSLPIFFNFHSQIV